MINKALFFFIYLFSFQSLAEDDCEIWFNESALKKDAQCSIRCSTLSVDMGTFDCPNRCDSLCKQTTHKSTLPFNYPKGLTKGDREMIAKHPADALKVYQAKQKADDLSLKVFKQQGRNDESDAFRHFVWAALVTKELGQEKANEFLNAHEVETSQPPREKEMDTINNNLGVEYVVKQSGSGKPVELDQIEKMALERLKSRELKVLTPSNKKIPDGYYSK